MANTRDTVLTALVAFAGGFLAGILLAPDSGAKTRERIAEEAKVRMRRLEGRLDSLQEQLAGLDDAVKHTASDISRKVKSASTQVGQKFREATQQAVDVLPADADAFHVDPADVTGDLRRMPRK